MDPHTLTFYTLAAALCFGLSMLLVGHVQLQRGTILIRSTAHALMVLALALALAGYGALLPTWVMRIVANSLLLASSVILYSGFHAYLHGTLPRFDHIGALMVAATLPAFVWWGMVEPDGIMRSIVFSLASALLNGRIAWVLLRLVRKQQGGNPARLLATLFAIGTLWMTGRAIVLMLAAPVPPEQLGANPTTWITVFWFNVLIAAVTATILAMERAHSAGQQRSISSRDIGSKRNNLVTLWTLVSVITLTILSEVGIVYSVLYQREYRQLQERTQLANKAFVEHTQQVIGQVDLLIRTTRKLVEQHTPPAEIEAFIRQLQFPRDQIENVFVIDATGSIVVPQADRAKGPFALQRDYFQFHRHHSEDELYISSVAIGQVTSKYQFRLTRRLSDAQGRFAGVVLVPLEPVAFTKLFQRLLPSPDAIAVLINTTDKMIRARSPAIDNPEHYLRLVDNTPLWNAFAQAAQGEYRNSSPIDGIERHYNYQRVGDLPLVMLSGFSLADVHHYAQQSIKPVGLGALLALTIMMSLAVILTGVIRRRDEQESFLSMLAHELKTPLSVIRMDIGGANISTESEARISRSVRAMQDVIDRCVQADRMASGLIHPDREPVDVAALLSMLRDESIAPARIAIDSAALPTCRTDPQLLRVILANLIDNALKYGQRDHPIRLSVAAESRKGRSGVALAVSNPPGTAGFPEFQNVFRKYYRAPAARSKTGSGLGLYIASGLARILSGELSYRPTDDTIKFELWIPT